VKAEPFVVSPRTYEPALTVLGVSVTVLASNIRGHGHETTLQSGRRDTGSPLHHQGWLPRFRRPVNGGSPEKKESTHE
jgi:hypothetical protein